MTASEFKLKMPHVLQVLATSKDIRKRHSALHFAITALNKSENDDKLTVVPSAITLVLRCLENECYMDTHKTHFEIVKTYLQLISTMFQLSSASIALKTFENIGADLMTMLIALHCDKFGGLVCQPLVLKLVDQFAGISEISLAQVRGKKCLVNLLQRVIRGDFPLPPRSCAIGIQLLSSWADQPQNKHIILNQPGLLGDILCSAKGKPVAGDETTTLYTANFLFEITWETQRKSELVVKEGFLETLLCFLNSHHQPTYGGLDTRRKTTNTIGQLATEAVCRVVICKHGCGSILKALIRGIDVPELCEATSRALLRLISQDTALYILKKVPNIIEQLVQCGQVSCTSEAPPVAAHCLKRISSFITVRNKTNSDLVDALTCLSGADHKNVRFWAAKGLCEQVKSSTGRFFVARDEKVLQMLIGLARNDSNGIIRSFATDALVLLASDTVNAKRLAGNSDVLEIFVQNAQLVHRLSSAGRASIQAILSLASHKTADKKRVAKTLDLVATLSEYGVSKDTDHTLKSAALHCVIILAPYM